jgi:hypothetical protein
MGIFKDQTMARLILDTKIDFTAYPILSASIKYEKPDTTEGMWTATILPGYERKGKIYVDFSNTIKFDVEGNWKFWAYLTFINGGVAMGDTIMYTVKSEGDE